MRIMVLPLALLLSACATQAPVPVAETGFVPVTLSEFSRGEVLVLPDAPPAGVFDNLGRHLAACPPQGAALARVPSGYRLTVGGGEVLLVRIAQVSESSAVNLLGPALTPELKETLASAALGRSACA